MVVSVTRINLAFFGFGSVDFGSSRFVVDDDVDCDGEEDADELLFDSISAIIKILFTNSVGTRILRMFTKFVWWLPREFLWKEII